MTEVDIPPTMPKIYLNDYQPPSYTVDKVDLDICLYSDHAIISSEMTMRRQHEGELVLLGRELELISIEVDGNVLSATDYSSDKEQLIINKAPEHCQIAIVVKIYPQTNTHLEGLYQAGDMVVTQCEPEGFRKITYFPDRPDVLSEFSTRVEADRDAYPILLANGNLVGSGVCEDDSQRHYTCWHDPSLKPSYLFACVMADLAVLTDHYLTSEGREVLLEIYAKPADIPKCHVAMQALKDSMAWDEQHYGRAYDLDRYMIVAVSQFNMGAMENKGLNIFNTVCVLSSPETTTDARNIGVKGVIAHEYFHNWTGNRITCRDWFQLCLKEGFTVYRDQCFTADIQTEAVQRINDVAMLKARQFPEDAGPLAHPPRPDHFVEINNFYTATVYEKGAEIMRMMANTLGKERFRQGTDEYFRRYDGQAVTVEDLLDALSVTDISVQPFLQWYIQPGTPVLSGNYYYDTTTQHLTLELSQHIDPVSGYPEPKPLPIPVDVAVFDRQSGELLVEQLCLLKAEQHAFDIDLSDSYIDSTVEIDPVVSVLRNFSAPVKLAFDYPLADLAFLAVHETNGFNRWQAMQALVMQTIQHPQETSIRETYLQALRLSLANINEQDTMLAARLLDIPAEQELSSTHSQDYDPTQIKRVRTALVNQVALYGLESGNEESEGYNPWLARYDAIVKTAYLDTPAAMAKRAWRNVLLKFAVIHAKAIADKDTKSAIAITVMGQVNQRVNQHYQQADCMTERLAALQLSVWYQLDSAQTSLTDFYRRFEQEDLVIDLWFGVQAADDNRSVADIVRLTKHADYDADTPNRMRAVVGTFSQQPTKLWTSEGLEFISDVLLQLDQSNPVMGARLLGNLSNWTTLIPEKRQIAHAMLENLQQQVRSKNVSESIGQLLQAADSKTQTQ